MTLLVASNPPASEMATLNTYVPATSAEATLLLAPLVPLALNGGVAAPAGLLMPDHVYARLDSPRLSPPRTDKLAVLPLRGFGVAAAAVTTVGFWCVRSHNCLAY